MICRKLQKCFSRIHGRGNYEIINYWITDCYESSRSFQGAYGSCFREMTGDRTGSPIYHSIIRESFLYLYKHLYIYMNFYESLGYLVLGSRLRRLSETFLSDVNRIYKAHHLKFDASWFPVFYILSRRESVSIRDISDELGVSHSAVSQLVSSLQEKGLIRSTAAAEDGRKKVVAFTGKGRRLQQQIEPVWQALQQAMETLAAEGPHSSFFLASIREVESGLQHRSVFDRVEAILDRS